MNGGPPQATDNPLLPRFPFDYVVPNMFSGSVLNLEPDTEYECRFVMTDPDGIKGEATKTAMVRTRKEPMPATGGKTYHVYPVDWKGEKQEPAFTGPDVRVLHGHVALRLRERVARAREARRRHPRPRRHSTSAIASTT